MGTCPNYKLNIKIICFVLTSVLIFIFIFLLLQIRSYNWMNDDDGKDLIANGIISLPNILIAREERMKENEYKRRKLKIMEMKTNLKFSLWIGMTNELSYRYNLSLRNNKLIMSMSCSFFFFHDIYRQLQLQFYTFK